MAMNNEEFTLRWKLLKEIANYRTYAILFELSRSDDALTTHQLVKRTGYKRASILSCIRRLKEFHVLDTSDAPAGRGQIGHPEKECYISIHASVFTQVLLSILFAEEKHLQRILDMSYTEPEPEPEEVVVEEQKV